MVELLAKTKSQKDEFEKNVEKLEKEMIQKQDQKADVVPWKYLDQINYLVSLLKDTRRKVTVGSQTETKLRKQIFYLVDLVRQQSS